MTELKKAFYLIGNKTHVTGICQKSMRQKVLARLYPDPIYRHFERHLMRIARDDGFVSRSCTCQSVSPILFELIEQYLSEFAFND